MNNKGLTLVEVLIAAVIFVVLAAGLTAVFFAANRQIIHSRERSTSAQLAKLFVDPLQNHVRQDTWNANRINVTDPVDTWVALGSQSVNGNTYTAQYKVTNVPSDGNLRKVVTKISWTETSVGP
ncbi:MAG: prepilin-type N-terminal cleavage/methylation domain-containing protein [Candidatus Omnitrophota bacterium]